MALEIPAEAQAALAVLRETFQDDLLGAYLHGSAVAAGLQPQSDVDLLAVIERQMTDAERAGLLAALLRISGRHPAPAGGQRCIELMLFLRSGLATLPFPARSTFLYGEWLRESFEAGEAPAPVSDPQITLVLAQARREARPLLGPPLAAFLPEIPTDQIRRAMRESLPALCDGLPGDERNVLLTLARMWRTAATGEFVAKDAAAEWAMPRLPRQAAAVLARARDAYLGRIDDDWRNRQAEVRQAAEHLRQAVADALRD